MRKKVDRKEEYNFKKGDKTHLDVIYNVQGIGGSDWWESDDDVSDYGDNITITRDNRFTITFYKTE